MRKKYLFKLLSTIMTTTTLVSVIATTAVSCSKEKSQHPNNNWNNFKRSVLSENATTIQSTIRNIEQYHWTDNDVAVFSIQSQADDRSQVINATIIIAGTRNSNHQLPIDCQISYDKNGPYNTLDWKFSQNSNIYTWGAFANSAVNISAQELLEQISDRTQYHWKTNDTAFFSDKGYPVANAEEKTISAIIIREDYSGDLLDLPINCSITWTKNIYQLSDWKFSQDPNIYQWEIFSNLSKQISANDLLGQISDRTQYHWKDSDFAEFSQNGYPTINYNTKTISATIEISGTSNSKYQLPINCNIIWTKNIAYNINNWTFSQSHNVDSWIKFKTSALAMMPSDLLLAAKNSATWSSFKWHTILSENKWHTNDKAEFDTYGGLNDADEYKGMNGKPTADDGNHTISAIISIKGKEGNYNADPIKAIISQNNNDGYKISHWNFSQTSQLQSRNKYLKLFQDQAIKSSTPTIDWWNKFKNSNWINEPGVFTNHTQSLGYWCTLNKYSFDYNPAFGKGLEFWSMSGETQYGFDSQIIIPIKSYNNHTFTVTINRYFEFYEEGVAVGPALDYSWDIEWINK